MKQKTKNTIWRAVVSALILLALFVGITAAATYVCRPYNSKADKVQKNLYSEDTDMEQTEIALIGGSHASNGFHPLVMWRDAGLKAYNFSFSGQPIYMSYYYLQELFKKRDFQLVVLDLYYIGMESEYFAKDSYVYEVMSNTRWTKEKWDIVQRNVAPEKRRRYYFPLDTYHTRWTELTKQDILRQPNPENDFWLGADFHFERNGGEEVHFEPWGNTGKVAKMPKKSEEYLRKIIELVQANDCEFLLVSLPHRYNDASPPDRWVADEYAVYNHAREIAMEYQVPMVQFDDAVQEKIGFVPERDMYNNGHMNVYGAEKVGSYLAEYMINCFHVTQHPRETGDLWDTYLAEYETVYEQHKQ